MDQNTLKQSLITILQEIQVESKLECPQLTGTLKPIEDIPEFDSKVWPVATTILAEKTGATILNDVNIFVDDSTNLPRSIDEVVCFVMDLQINQGKSSELAA